MIRKLTSRKFWMSLATFISMMTVAMGGTEDKATQIAALVMAGGAAIAYTLGEGFIDAARVAEDAGTAEETEE